MSRLATWGKRISAIVVLVFLGSILVVGYTPATFPQQVPDPIAEPIEENANETGSFNVSAFIGGAGEVLSEPKFNQTEYKFEVHQQINEVREKRGLSQLHWDKKLSKIAEYHSNDMVERGYYAHTAPSGESMEDRYEEFGYDCSVPISGNRYATGAENINKIYWDTKTYTYGYIENESKLAKETIEQWMDSPGHRKNILQPYWKNEGIGVAVNETSDGDTMVYVTQNFC